MVQNVYLALLVLKDLLAGDVLLVAKTELCDIIFNLCVKFEGVCVRVCMPVEARGQPQRSFLESSHSVF